MKLIAQDSAKFSDLRKYSDKFFIELESHSGPVTIYRRSKPVAIMLAPHFLNKIDRKPEINWGNSSQSMKFLSRPLIELKSADVVQIINNERGQ